MASAASKEREAARPLLDAKSPVKHLIAGKQVAPKRNSNSSSDEGAQSAHINEEEEADADEKEATAVDGMSSFCGQVRVCFLPSLVASRAPELSCSAQAPEIHAPRGLTPRTVGYFKVRRARCAREDTWSRAGKNVSQDATCLFPKQRILLLGDVPTDDE